MSLHPEIRYIENNEGLRESKEAIRAYKLSIANQAIDNSIKSADDKITHKSIPYLFKFLVNHSYESAQDFKSLYREYIKTGLPELTAKLIITSLDYLINKNNLSSKTPKDEMDDLTRKLKLYNIINSYDFSSMELENESAEFYKEVSSFFILNADPVYYAAIGKISKIGKKLIENLEAKNMPQDSESEGNISYTDWGTTLLSRMGKKERFLSDLEDILSSISINPSKVDDYGLGYKTLHKSFLKNGFFAKEGVLDCIVKSFFVHGKEFYDEFYDWQAQMARENNKEEVFDGIKLRFEQLKEVYEKNGLFSKDGLLNHVADAYYHIDSQKIDEYLSLFNSFVSDNFSIEKFHGLLHENGLVGKDGALKYFLDVFLTHGKDIYDATVIAFLEESMEDDKAFESLSKALDFDLLKQKFNSSNLMYKDGLAYHISDSVIKNLDKFKQDGSVSTASIGAVAGILKGIILMNENLGRTDKETKLNKRNEFAYELMSKAKEKGKTPIEILKDKKELAAIATSVYGSIDDYIVSFAPFREIEENLIVMLDIAAKKDWKDDLMGASDYIFGKQIEEYDAKGFAEKLAQINNSNIKDYALFYSEFLKQKNQLLKEEREKLIHA